MPDRRLRLLHGAEMLPRPASPSPVCHGLGVLPSAYCFRLCAVLCCFSSCNPVVPVLLEAYEGASKPWRWVGHKCPRRFILEESGLAMFSSGHNQNTKLVALPRFCGLQAMMEAGATRTRTQWLPDYEWMDAC